MKAMSKQQLADAAGVSVKVLMSWCRPYLCNVKTTAPAHREVDADNWRRCARQPGKVSTTTGEVDNDNKGR